MHDNKLARARVCVYVCVCVCMCVYVCMRARSHLTSRTYARTVIDLEEFGLRGEEPDAVRMLREMVQKEDPAFVKLVHGDEPLVQKYMEDPGAAWKEAQAINPELKKVAESIAANSKRRKKRLAA